MLSESLYGQGSVHERDFFYAAPLIIICAIAWATNGRPRPRLLSVLIAGAVIGFAASIPAGTINGNEIDALSFKLWAHINYGPLSPGDWILVVTAAGALAVLMMRSPWPLVFAIAVSLVGVAAASDYRTNETQAEANRYTWVDQRVPASSRVTVLFIGNTKTGCPMTVANSPFPICRSSPSSSTQESTRSGTSSTTIRSEASQARNSGFGQTASSPTTVGLSSLSSSSPTRES